MDRVLAVKKLNFMKLQKVLIPQKDSEPLTYLETERYVFTDYELTNLLMETFDAGQKRVLNMDDDTLSMGNYITNLFK